VIDHFDARSTANFSQKYLIDWGSLDPSADHSNTPVFLIVGGEMPLTAATILGNECTSLADNHSAIIIGLEHRYYGDSVVGNLTADGLHYLTTEQALADIATFQAAMRQTYRGVWFAFGCSYGGVLAAWYRLKYPHMTKAALAASAPVQAIVSFYQLDQLVAAAAGDACARALRQARSKIETRLLANESGTLQDFGCAALTDTTDFLYVLADIVAFGVQMDSEYHFRTEMCNNFTTVPPEYAYTTYLQYARFLFKFSNTTCADWSLSSFTDPVPSPTAYMRQWTWQTCTELGYFQTAPSEKPLRSPNITVAYHLGVCQRLFGFGAPRMPVVDRINADYGGADNFTGTNVIFSNGDEDPWRALSVTSPINPTVPAVLIKGQSHCANWLKESKADSPDLIRGRELVASYVAYFLDPTTLCGQCKNNATCAVGPEGADATHVTATCTCLEGWVGDDCNSNVYVTAGLYILIIAAGSGILFALFGIVLGRCIALRGVRKNAERRSLLRA
jgi:pimeloyl-ACP methyl ester carboxylesterase